MNKRQMKEYGYTMSYVNQLISQSVTDQPTKQTAKNNIVNFDLSLYHICAPARASYSSVSSRWYLRTQESPHALHPVSQKFSRFFCETVPTSDWLTMAFSRPFKESRREISISTPLFSGRSMVCDVLGFVPATCVSSSSTLQIRKPVVMAAFPTSLSARSLAVVLSDLHNNACDLLLLTF